MRHARRRALLALAVAITAGVGASGLAPGANAGVIAVAVPDTATAVSGVQRSIAAPGVLANDLQVLGGNTADLVSDVSHGNLTLDPNGGYRYRSDGGFVGTDQFRYRILGGLLPSNTTTVTITVSAPAPTPTPTPAPTPAPTPTPTPKPTATPTPAPTATPTPAPTAAPTAGPTPTPAPGSTPRPTPTPTPTARPTLLPTLPPLPTLSPLATVLPSLVPLPTSTPLPTPSARPGPTSSPAPTSRPTASDPGLGGGPVDSTGGDPGGGSSGPRVATTDTFTLPVADDDGTIELDFGSVAFTGFEWAVPALVLSVPGLFLILVVAVQGAIGLAWIPVARRWVGEDDRVHRQRRRRLSPS